MDLINDETLCDWVYHFYNPVRSNILRYYRLHKYQLRKANYGTKLPLFGNRFKRQPQSLVKHSRSTVFDVSIILKTNEYFVVCR